MGETVVKCGACGADNPEGKKFCGECGAPLLVPPPSIQPTQPTPALVKQNWIDSRRGRMHVSVNALGLVGAILGIAAIFTVWVKVSLQVSFILSYSRSYNLIELVNEAGIDSDWGQAALLFIVGTLIALVTPIGGFIQLTGVTFYFTVFMHHADGKLPSGVGPYLGLASAVIAIGSMARPLGPGLIHGDFNLKNRLLVFSRSLPTRQIDETG